MKLEYFVFSDQGMRDNNEDFAGGLSTYSEGAFVLCDGLGGHGRGEVASKLVVEKILEVYRKEKDSKDFLKDSLEYSQKELLNLQRKENSGNEMKTTAVVLHIREKEMQWAHVGDSRLYMFYKNKLKTRTLDHSVPQMLVSAGEIKEKEIRNHPDRNRLLRVMGIDWDKAKYVIANSVEKKSSTAFLLCSDGFWELIAEKQMEKCLKKAKSPKEWIELMKDIVLANGKDTDMDNYSAIAVWCEE